MPATTIGLTSAEMQRYARHLALPQVGLEGQRRLKAAKVLLVGVGGLGSPAAMYLAAAGIGTLGLVDHDVVDASNLQRQVLHGTSDIGTPKLESAVRRLREINPEVLLTTHDALLTSGNALDILGDYDVVVDGSDNFPTRYLVNDACALLGKPDVYGSIHRFEGQVSVFDASRGPCYRCLYRDPPPPELVPSCEEGGVLGVLPGIIGSLQAAEAIKLVLGAGDVMIGRLLLADVLAMRFRELTLERDPECPLCGTHAITSLIDYDAFCGVTPQRTTREPGSMDWTVTELKEALAAGKPVKVVDVREDWEWELGHIEDAIHIPLATLPEHVAELEGAETIVTVCHRGSRSMQAARYLAANGLNVKNLKGGMDAWSVEVDPTIARY